MEGRLTSEGTQSRSSPCLSSEVRISVKKADPTVRFRIAEEAKRNFIM